MVNPFEETAQAARDWNPREDFISSQGVDQSIQGLIRSQQKNQQRWEDLGREDAYPTINKNITPTSPNKYIPSWQEAGITNRNLGGYKVMNALSIDPMADDFFLRELFNYGKRYFPGYDREQDEWRQKKYRDSLKGEEAERNGEEFPWQDKPYVPYLNDPNQLLDLFPFPQPPIETPYEKWKKYRNEGETGTLEANRGGIIGLL